MMSYVKKYIAFLYGLILVIVLKFLLEAIGFIRIDYGEVAVNIFLFIFWWMIISLPIYKWAYIKKNIKFFWYILGLASILILTLSIDSYLNIPDNPITIFLVTLFWIGVLRLFIPSFYAKYNKYIFGVYLLSFLYFSYVRLFSGNFEFYQEHEKGVAFAMFLFPIPVFMCIWIYEQWKWLKILKAEKATAELALLKSQINPHFFFNTLNNLYGLIVEKSDEAPEVVLKLSDMMRYTIYEGKKEAVNIKDEIAYLENYIELHKIRYQKKVDISFTKILHDDLSISPLLYIILLENAFKHGVERLTEDAYIHIDVYTNEAGISFSIENNFEENTTSSVKGIGLDNLKQRLSLIYPDKHRLAFEVTESVYKVILDIETK